MSLSQGNEIAFAALILWLAFAGLPFAFAPAPLAGAIALIAAALCLPHGVELVAKGLPELGKNEVGAFSVLFYCLLLYRSRLGAARPGRGLDALVLIMVVGAVGTVLTNQDSLTFDETTLSGLTIYDAVSMGSRDVLRVGIPFFLGRSLFRTTRDLRLLMTALVAAAAAYSVLAVFEMRMGPQLMDAVYGVDPGVAHKRYGTFRPFVFMGGLSLALFLACATIASVTLSRASIRVLGFSSGILAAYLGSILFLTRSLGSILYATVVVPAVVLLKPRLQMHTALILSLVGLGYPLLRTMGVVPVDAMISAASFIDVSRSQSLAFRFENEDLLLSRARERMVLGWGGWNRSVIFLHGRPETVADGWWIIVLGQRGLVGFLAHFGLLTVPVLLAQHRLTRVRLPEREQRLIAGFSLIVAVSTVDLLPNTLWTYFAPVFAGGLAGVVQDLPRRQTTPARPVREARSARTLGVSTRLGLSSSCGELE